MNINCTEQLNTNYLVEVSLQLKLIKDMFSLEFGKSRAKVLIKELQAISNLVFKNNKHLHKNNFGCKYRLLNGNKG